MKKFVAYTNTNKIGSFLKKDDELVSIENGKFEHWGKSWKVKTTFTSAKKVNKICADYNLGTTSDNILIAD